jgi:hypothetical protein
VNQKPTKSETPEETLINSVNSPKIQELLTIYSDKLTTFCKTFMKNQFKQSKLDTIMTKYIESMTTYLMEFDNTSWNDNVYPKLFIPELYKTWDIYSMGITFASILDNKLTDENMDEYNPFLDLLHSIIFSIPTERPNYDKIMEVFSTL